MSIELIIELMTLFAFVTVNIVSISVLFSKLSTKISHLEKEMASCRESDLLHNTKFDTLHKVEAQLELIIAHLYPKQI